MICIFLEKAYQVLLSVLSASTTQTIILMATALITWYIFKKQVKQREQEAAAIVLLEIESIYKTIKANMEYINNDVTFDIQRMWSAVKVCNKNSWEGYRQILVKHLSGDEINIVNTYYKYTTIIDEQIETFHNIIYATYENFYIERKMKPYKEIENEKPYIRTFTENLFVLKTYCEKAISLHELLPISTIEKISK